MPLPRATARALQGLYRQYRRGEVTVQVVAKAFRDALGESFTAEHERLFLLKILSRDGTLPSGSELIDLYVDYVARKGKANLTAADAVQWLLSETKGRARQILLGTLGQGYANVIRRAMARDAIPIVTEAALALLKKLEYIPNCYRDLRKELLGFGRLFEADHLLEKRFLNSPLADEIDINADDIFALAVPKNGMIAKQIYEKLQTVKELIPYVHSEKTQMLRRLIPNGLEDKFTVQQWWDAHVFVYESLDVAIDNYLPRLKQMFGTIKGGNKINYRTGLTPDMFNKEAWRKALEP